MFNLPDDIDQSLKRKYPDININKIFNDIINEMLEKTFKDGSCPIRKFGKFLAFSKYSKRKGKHRVRFKFIVAKSFTKKVIDDEYIIKNLPVKVASIFDEKHKLKCEGKENEKKCNHNALREASENEKKAKNNRLARNEILNALMDNQD